MTVWRAFKIPTYHEREYRGASRCICERGRNFPPCTCLRCSRARVILLSSRRLYIYTYIYTYKIYIYAFMRGSTRVEKGMEKPREGFFRAEKEETLVRMGKEREKARKGMR